MQDFVAKHEPTQNVEAYVVYYYLLQLALTEGYREFFKMKHWLGDRYSAPDYSKETRVENTGYVNSFMKNIGKLPVPAQESWPNLVVKMSRFIEEAEELNTLTFTQREAVMMEQMQLTPENNHYFREEVKYWNAMPELRHYKSEESKRSAPNYTPLLDEEEEEKSSKRYP
jgi:hypothetical protein